MIMKIVFCVSPTLCNAGTEAADRDAGRLYAGLDSLIDMQEELVRAKQERIELIRGALGQRNLTYPERYSINDRLYEEYVAFKYDSAYKYVTRNIELALRENDMTRYHRSRLKLVHIVNVAGLFDEARELLEGTDTLQLEPEDLINYYNRYCELYLFKAEFSQGTDYYGKCIASATEYQRKILASAPKDSQPYIFTRAARLCQEGKCDEAIELLESRLGKSRPGERDYSVITGTLALYYNCKSDTGQRKEYLVMSAMSDLKGSIRENNSLRKLAYMLFEDGDMDRAYRYMNISIEDANLYGTRLRCMQAMQMLPQIRKAYLGGRDTQHRRMVVMLTAISIVSLLLILGISFIAVLVRRYSNAHRKIHEMNSELGKAVEKLGNANDMMRESSKIKEEYIGRFLELSSTFIDKMEEQRKMENRLAREHKLPELYEVLKSNRTNAENTRLFYKNFDSTFLNIYPDFVQEINKLLQPRYRIMPKEDGERLTTELRILALIRLGITDNQKIASILRSSITTIYTYRSKFKNRSTVKDGFESHIRNIYSYT